ncbi:MAG: hypothetical protein HY833_00640 [Candidatus Aenigmarchaeota archaeon]|nr:hypothetical protein [Candidatus Aenigmarchaeota archaeon]
MEKNNGYGSKEYVRSGVGFLLPKMEDIMVTLKKVKPHKDNYLVHMYNDTYRGVAESISVLKDIEKYPLRKRVKIEDDVSAKISYYMLNLGRLQEATSGK